MEEIGAFTEGNSFVHTTENKLLVGNSIGILKVFPLDQNEEPKSIDIQENLTSISHYGDKALITNTAGCLELVDLKDEESKIIYRCELPLRDSVFINEGKRMVVGGDESYFMILNHDNDEKLKIDIPDQLVNLSYNATSELLSVTLSSGDLKIYSVSNEQPNLIETLDKVLQRKVLSSLDEIDFENDHKNELLCTRPSWNSLGDNFYLPASPGVTILNREYEVVDKIEMEKVIDFQRVNNFLVILVPEQVNIWDLKTKKIVKSIKLKQLSINLHYNNHLFIGTNQGFVVKVPDVIKELQEELGADDLGFSDDEPVEDAMDEDVSRNGIDDSIIDDDEEFPYYNKDVSKVFENQDRKRQRLSPPSSVSSSTMGYVSHDFIKEITPYSPGSTPFKNNGGIERRYLMMSSIGYVWAVKNESQQSVTVSFFDRSINKDYHFNDYSNFDLCGINSNGIILGYSNVQGNEDCGIIYYRTHQTEQDSWDKKIPLHKGEFITCVSITESDDATIVVGTNFGNLRVFNQHGLCIKIMKVNPIISIISNNTSIFIITQLTINLYAFSIFNLSEDKFIQQDCILPLKQLTTKPLIKGIFFNEFNDPCLVPGSDDTLMILSGWREPMNCKWIPILNCKTKWKCWPLGLFNDKLNCLLLKNNDEYPGFPLSLPIELDLKLPINHQDKKQKEEEEDFEEIFVQASTMGKIANDSLVDTDFQQFNDEISEKLSFYTNQFDKSLLQLFVKTCQQSNLNKAFSIAKLMNNDKALIAATKICQRFEFNSLATKIGKLRDQLVDVDDI